MSYPVIRQCRVGDIESIVFNEQSRQQAVENAVNSIWAYHQQALLLGTEADILAYDAPTESSRAAYRSAYLCQLKAVQILDAFYGMIPSGRVPCMEDLLAAAEYFAEHSGSRHSALEEAVQ